MQHFIALIDQYEADTLKLRQATQGMTREQAAAYPVPGKWSTIECVAHIADFEPIFASRMMLIISHDRPLLTAADENMFFATLDYTHRDLEEELQVFESTRKKLTRILRGINKETANRVGIHTFKGLVSMEATLSTAVHHMPHHLKFIEEKRKALGT
jgi:hypothetical protein